MTTLIAFYYLFLIPSAPGSKNECACHYEIYYEEFGMAKAPCELPSSQIIYNNNLKTEIIITSCEGDASFKSYDSLSEKIKITGSLKKAGFIDQTDTTYILDEMDYSETIKLQKRNYWTPVKIGAWFYY